MVTFMFYVFTIFCIIATITHTLTITEKATAKLKSTIKNVAAEEEKE